MAPSIAPPVPNCLRLAKSSAGARPAMLRRLQASDCRQNGSFMRSALCGMAEAVAKMNCSPAAIGVAWNWRESTKRLRLRFRPSVPVFIDSRKSLRHGLPFAPWKNTPRAAESQSCTLSASIPRHWRSMNAFSQAELGSTLPFRTRAPSHAIPCCPDIRAAPRGVIPSSKSSK